MADVRQECALRLCGSFGSCLGLLQLLFRAFALGNVFDSPFVVEERTTGVTHGARRLRNPDDLTIVAIDLGFKPRHRAVLLQQTGELIAAGGVHIELPTNVGQTTDQSVGRRVPIDPGQGRIHTDVAPVGCGLENALDGILKNTAVFCLGLP